MVFLLFYWTNLAIFMRYARQEGWNFSYIHVFLDEP